MMDPFQKKYGRHLTAALAIVPVISEGVWTAGVLNILGTIMQNLRTCCHILSLILVHFELTMCDYDPGATMSMVLNLSRSLCIWISAAVAIIYTVLGGLYSVAWTDVIQVSLVLIGMVGSSDMVVIVMLIQHLPPLNQASPMLFPVFTVAVRPVYTAQ